VRIPPFDCGLSTMTVSSMESGAGSVGYPRVPLLPGHDNFRKTHQDLIRQLEKFLRLRDGKCPASW